MQPHPPRSTLFPYTTLFRSSIAVSGGDGHWTLLNASPDLGQQIRATSALHPKGALRGRDRKSTRLNSSHLGISYAVFCLKKKTLDKQGIKHSRLAIGKGTVG